MLAAQKCGLEVYEYTPLQVKQSVVGYGRAEKKQVQEMTRLILHLSEIPSRTIPPMRLPWPFAMRMRAARSWEN